MKICFVLTTRGNYAKFRVLMRLVRESEHELQVVTGGEFPDRMVLPFEANYECNFNLTGTSIAWQIGLATSQFSNAFLELEPDIIFIVGDRFETFAAAQAAYYLRIPIAHLEGGEKSGTLDDKVRYAISYLSTYHFPCTEKAEEKLRNLGFKKVWNVGCTSLDEWPTEFPDYDYGIDVSKPYLLIIHHPDTLHPENIEKEHKAIQDAVDNIGMQYYWVGPNMDEGAIQRGKSLPIELFGPLLAHAACIVGNSSSGIREASYFGVPNVCVGDRQDSREFEENTFNSVLFSSEEIEAAIYFQLHGKYQKHYTYGNGTASKQIMEVLCTLE